MRRLIHALAAFLARVSVRPEECTHHGCSNRVHEPVETQVGTYCSPECRDDEASEMYEAQQLRGWRDGLDVRPAWPGPRDIDFRGRR